MATPKKAVVVVTGAYKLDPDMIEPMLMEAVKIGGFEGINHLRIIPEGSPILRSWASRQLNAVEGARLSLYEAKHFQGPIRRNNAAILGGESAKGKAHLIVQLGEVPPHTDERASTQEALLYFWQSQKNAPTIVQVLDHDGTPVPMKRTPASKYAIHEEEAHRTLTPPPKSGNKPDLAKRSAGFWSDSK